MKCTRNVQKDSSSTQIERLQKNLAEKGKCKWSEKAVAEGTKVTTNVSIGRHSAGDQDSALVTMMTICYSEL
jgi:hypothetical protein